MQCALNNRCAPDNPILQYLSEPTILILLIYFFNYCFQDPLDPEEACQGPRGVTKQYQTTFQIGSYVDVVNVNSTICTAGRCSHTFQPPSNLSSSSGRVLVAAENVVGMGVKGACTTHTISEQQCYLVLLHECRTHRCKTSAVDSRLD